MLPALRRMWPMLARTGRAELRSRNSLRADLGQLASTCGVALDLTTFAGETFRGAATLRQLSGEWVFSAAIGLVRASGTSVRRSVARSVERSVRLVGRAAGRMVSPDEAVGVCTGQSVERPVGRWTRRAAARRVAPDGRADSRSEDRSRSRAWRSAGRTVSRSAERSVALTVGLRVAVPAVAATASVAVAGPFTAAFQLALLAQRQGFGLLAVCFGWTRLGVIASGPVLAKASWDRLKLADVSSDRCAGPGAKQETANHSRSR